MGGEDPPDRGARLVEVRAHAIPHPARWRSLKGLLRELLKRLGLREKEIPAGYGC